MICASRFPDELQAALAVPDSDAHVLRFAVCDVYRSNETLEDPIGVVIATKHYDDPDRTFYPENYVVMLNTIDTKLVSLRRNRADHDAWYFVQAGIQSGMGAR